MVPSCHLEGARQKPCSFVRKSASIDASRCADFCDSADDGIHVAILDAHKRPLANLRLSVTDRCNLRCQYCMPEEDYLWLPREDILQFEEIDRLVDQFLYLGVEKVRLTGGEPLLRTRPAGVDRAARAESLRSAIWR